MSKSACLSDLPPEAQAQLTELDKAQALMQYILVGTVMRYHLFDVQREQLLRSVYCPNEAVALPNTFQMESVSSLLILYALSGYAAQNQALAAKAPADSPTRASIEQDGLWTMVVLLVALLRFFKLLSTAPVADVPLLEDSLDDTV